MAFTEAQLLSDMSDGGLDTTIRIIGFIPGATVTDVYVENNNTDSRMKTGPWVQIPNSSTAAQAHALIDAAMA